MFEEYFNPSNRLHIETTKSADHNPYSEPNDPRRKNSDGQIIDNTINLNQYCFWELGESKDGQLCKAVNIII